MSLACAREMKNVYRIIVENLKRRDQMGDLGVDAMIILKQILKN
jgi:hypothetical protein